MTKIAIQTNSDIIRIGFKEILKNYEVVDYNTTSEIDLLLFENEELIREKVKKIRLIRTTEIPLNNDYSIISIYSTEQEVLDSVDKTLRNHIYIEERLKEIKRQRNKKFKILKDLSRREKFLLEEIIKGKSNKEISQTIYISEKTVKNNLTDLYKKLEVRGREEIRRRYSKIISQK